MTEPSADLIKKTREKISKINISLLGNSLPNDSFVNELDKALSELQGNYILAGSTVDEKDYEIKSHQLIKSFKAFEKFHRSKPEVDSLKKVFRLVNDEFNSLFGNYFLGELRKSSNKKIILFSTSMSCECTLEMCYKQEAEIQKLLKENLGLFDYAVVDSYSNYELQNEFNVGFIPTVILINSDGKEKQRYSRSENLYAEINSLLNTRRNK